MLPRRSRYVKASRASNRTRARAVFAAVAVAGGDGGATAVGAAQPSFVPPKFPAVGAHHEDGSLIKPSEYLRSIVGSCGGGTGPETTAVPAESATGGAAADHHQHHHRTPPPPPPPLLHRTKSELSVAAAVGQHQHQKQPLAAISIQDLHSVQLKKTPGTVRIAGAMNCGVAAKQPGESCVFIFSRVGLG